MTTSVVLEHFLGMARARRPVDDAWWIVDLMRQRGSVDYGRIVARQLAGAAQFEFVRAFGDRPPSEAREFVGQVIRLMISRDL